MTTRVYANGVRATAISNIVADLASYLSYSADGILTVDTQGLKAYLISQFESISTTPEYVSPATAASSLAAARAVDYDSLVAQLVAAIGEAHWASRTDWPTGTDVLQGAALVSAVNSGIAACKLASDAVTNYYATLNSDLSDYVTAFYYGQGIDQTVTPGVVRQIETRAVVHTYVSDRGEESAPSAPSTLVNMDQNDTATYTVAETAPTGRHIAKIRWYRSRSSNAGADYAYVDEVAYNPADPTTLTYHDTKLAETLGDPCETLTWIEPPADLIGVVNGPNGGMGGFRFNSNDAFFCENDVPYAWPAEYRKTTAWPIVAMGSFDQTYVILTRGKPYYASGTDSASLTMQLIDSNQACVSRRSVVNVDGGTIFAAPDGLCLASFRGVTLISGDYFTRKEWQALNPASIIAAEFDGAYVFVCDGGAYAFHPGQHKLVTLSISASAMFRDLVTDTLYIASGPSIIALFKDTTLRTGTWRTKIASGQHYENWKWAQVFADGTVTLKVYRDGVLTDTKTITDSKPVKLVSKRAREYEVEIVSTAKITSIACAASSEELRTL